jgi:hypothetical protein
MAQHLAQMVNRFSQQKVKISQRGQRYSAQR